MNINFCNIKINQKKMLKKILFEFKDKIHPNKFKITNQDAMCLLNLNDFMIFFRKNSTANILSSHEIIQGPIIVELYSFKFEISDYTLGNIKDEQFYIKFNISNDGLFPLFSMGKTYDDNFTITVKYSEDKVLGPPQLFCYVDYINKDVFVKKITEGPPHRFKITHFLRLEDVADRLAFKIENPRHLDYVSKITWKTKNKYDYCVLTTKNTVVEIPYIISLQSRNYHEYNINNIISDVILLDIKFFDKDGVDVTSVVHSSVSVVFEDQFEFFAPIPEDREANKIILVS